MYKKSSFCADARDCLEAETEWHVATASQNNGGCVEAGWVKSSFTNPNACVEAQWTGECQGGTCVEASSCTSEADSCGLVHVRDTKQADFEDCVILDFSREAWDNGNGLTFVPVARKDVPANLIFIRDSRVAPADIAARDTWFKVSKGGVALYFDAAEVSAFREGVKANEFTAA
jgi:hypothetical protein